MVAKWEQGTRVALSMMRQIVEYTDVSTTPHVHLAKGAPQGEKPTMLDNGQDGSLKTG